MSTVTLAAIEAAHQKVSEMIAKFKDQAKRLLSIPGTQIDLREGEHYAGLILDDNGAPSHHVVLLPGDADEVTWDEAKAFAEAAGGELPTRREQALLYSNLKDQFEQRYYWSGEQHAGNSDYAWDQYFDDGTQDNIHKSASLRARAVRRLTIQ